MFRKPFPGADPALQNPTPSAGTRASLSRIVRALKEHRSDGPITAAGLRGLVIPGVGSSSTNRSGGPGTLPADTEGRK